ncbi:MAG: hypothetical protein JNM72_12395 [Deltaproteobacteria bacterium]|nr:hypothetical protein [Deltaproteobacteria bacterium]
MRTRTAPLWALSLTLCAPAWAQEPTPTDPIPAGEGAEAAPGTPETSAEAPPPAGDWGGGDWGSDAVPETIFETKVYGFIDSYWEKSAKTPEGVDDQGRTVWEENPSEFDVLNFNVMVQGSVHQKYRYFINIAAPGAGGAAGDEPLALRNAWVEAPLAGRYLSARVGKLYRRFGLYNEILDASPTFIGIEPPEIFDKDHLMLTRTTNLMLHGSAPVGDSTLVYSVSTGNDERIDEKPPIGADVYLDVRGVLRLGSSYYDTRGAAGPMIAVGDGSPRGGVVNWMAEDRYKVMGGYAQLTTRALTLQGEYWRSPHEAERSPDAVAQLADAGLNPRQLDRYFVNGDPAQGTAKEQVSYLIETAYVRAGYQLAVGDKASVTPYGQWDYYRNPETIKEKDFGGDDEAGVADDNQFVKYTAGLVIRPVPQVALKVDGSAHQFVFNGEPVYYPEARVSLSYLWQLKD